jgi:hypothetical protein
VHSPNDNITSLLFVVQNRGPEGVSLSFIQCKYLRRHLVGSVSRLVSSGATALDGTVVDVVAFAFSKTLSINAA